VPVGHRPDDGVAAGEVVFNTALVGYQEIVTDPSYAGRSSRSRTRTSGTTASTATTTKRARRTAAA
jgi:carbamoylphosphate synthase small subunit